MSDSRSPARAWAEELAPALRDELLQHWLRREQHELQVGDAFAQLGQLLRGFAEPVVVETLLTAAREEQRHAECCHDLAQIYAGSALSAPARLPAPLSDFGSGDAATELSLNLVGLCCVNETLATAWLRYGLELTRVPELAKLGRAHLSDEIDHARAGWAHLASRAVTPDMRSLLEQLLPKLLEVNLAQWLSPTNFLSGSALPAHGHPSAASSRRQIERAMVELVVPGFSYLGLASGTGSHPHN